MSKIKFTPGPWVITKVSNIKTIPVGPDAFMTTAFVSGFDSLEQKANAHLVASAPEMYAALEAIKAACNQPGQLEVKGDFIGGMIFGLAAEQVDNALKKARGE